MPSESTLKETVSHAEREMQALGACQPLFHSVFYPGPSGHLPTLACFHIRLLAIPEDQGPQ